MVSKELIKKIRQVEIKSNKLVEEIFSGEYRSGFRGKGIEFDDIREYYPGDDVRNIDWNVTARHNKAFVKQFCEERELNMFLLIDMSRSNSFGNKKDLIAEVSATLAFSACKNNDKVGVIFFTDKVEKFIPSSNGRKHVLSIIEHILSFEPESAGTDLAKALQYFNRVVKRHSVVFVISDFLDDGYIKDIKITDRKHDLVLIHIIDRAEELIPAGAIFTFEDLETGETLVLDNMKEERKINTDIALFKRNLINIYTDEDYVKPLKQFFRRRGQK
ncbi:DUF58 domain-containing protein [Acetivibrio clariflavus]|uniref:DUF58 domain-containing protein n=1 Tax=Acetivibrio clariflavus (strain DSM 19732 / NBRC 101661 / EBR45) TaxID=720554 RepID=G8LZE6_ACECE|nr:DUF58 domain-containing protein [Acetivibrio clariflavus]AEV66809.1 hypothetical protein Clocl_0051 [Acetivibrio clariflavus DSM 19732]